MLRDGVTITVSGSISIPEGSTLRIYGQSGDTGKLVISSAAGSVISGDGALEIHGGNVVLENKTSNPASLDVKTFTVYGGTFSADSIADQKSGGIVTIYGGTVNTKGIDATYSQINIYGGTVNAESDTAAGIGLFSNATSAATGAVNIYGGTVIARGGEQGAGIGIASGSASIDVTISGGTVSADGGMGGISVGEGATLLITGGKINASQIGSNDKEVTFIGYVNNNDNSPSVTVTGSYKSIVTISPDQIFADNASTVNYYGGTLAENHRAALSGKTLKPYVYTGYYAVALVSSDIASDDSGGNAYHVSLDKSAAQAGSEVKIYISGDMQSCASKDYTILYTLQIAGTASNDWKPVDNNGLTLPITFTMPNAKTSVDVKLQPKVHTITYHLDSGSFDIDDLHPETYTMVSADAGLVSITSPDRFGYTFTGWTLSEDKTIFYSGDVRVPKGMSLDLNYIASWDLNYYTISYENHETYEDMAVAVYNNSAFSYSFSAVSQDFTLPVLYMPDEAYDFKGWTGGILSSDNTTILSQDEYKDAYTGTATTSLTISQGSWGNRKYTAQWSPKSYTISYDLAGGSWADDETSNPTSYDSTTGESVTLGIPTRDGYNFAGWVLSGDEEAVPNLEEQPGLWNGDLYYRAVWNIVSYDITYNLDGGSFDNGVNPNPSYYTAQSEDIHLQNPTKDYYDFAGWSGTKIDGLSTDVTIPAGSSGSRDYTANWTATVYTIAYTLNGGSFDAGVNPNPTSYDINTPLIKLVNPTKDGYSFLGWTGSADVTESKDVNINKGSTGNRSYIANWSEPITYTISYDLSYGDTAFGGYIDDNPTSYDATTKTFTLAVPEWDGYTFLGWVLSGDSSSEASTSVSLTKGSAGDRYYLAMWKVETYTITYNGVEGATFTEANPTSYTAETESFTLNTPTKKYYTFAGWTGTGLNGATDTVTIQKGSTGNRTYTANWESKGFVPDDEYTPQLYGKSLLLDGNIGVVFYVYIPDEDANGNPIDPSEYEMSFDVNGDTSLNSEPVGYDGDYVVTSGDATAYGFVCYVNSLQMADEIHASLFASSEATTSDLDLTYSVKEYLDTVKERYAEDSAMYKLAEAIRDYGHYAQIMLAKTNGFTLGTDYATLESTTTYDDAAISAVKTAVEAYTISRPFTEGNGISRLPVSLMLDSGTSINLDFFLSEAANAGATFTVKLNNAGKNLATYFSDYKAYRAQITNIQADDFEEEYSLTVNNQTVGAETFEVKVSVLAYINAILSAENMSDENINGVVSLYNYHAATEAYIESLH